MPNTIPVNFNTFSISSGPKKTVYYPQVVGRFVLMTSAIGRT
ncbi:hypothetical protein [Bacillus oleivorans]|nr:hypothetical protein [Bacillus oleivorans]